MLSNNNNRSRSEREPCTVIENGSNCSSLQDQSEIFEKFQEAYRDKLHQVDQIDVANKNEAKIRIYEQWVGDLAAQNINLYQALEDIGVEATNRVSFLEAKLQQNSDVLNHLKGDIVNLLEVIRRVREENVLSAEDLVFFDVKLSDIYGDFKEMGGVKCKLKEDFPNVTVLSEQLKKLEGEKCNLQTELESTKINLKQSRNENEKLKAEHLRFEQSKRDMRNALTEEVAEKHDQVSELRRDVEVLKNKCREIDQQVHLKDEIIKQLRKDIKKNKKFQDGIVPGGTSSICNDSDSESNWNQCKQLKQNLNNLKMVLDSKSQLLKKQESQILNLLKNTPMELFPELEEKCVLIQKGSLFPNPMGLFQNLKMELDELHQITNKYVDELNENIQNLDQVLSKCDCEDLKQRLDSKQQKIMSLEKKWQEMQNHVEDLQNINQKLEHVICHSTDALSTTSDEPKIQQHQVEHCRQEIMKLEQKLIQKQLIIDNHTKTYESNQDTISSLKQKLRESESYIIDTAKMESDLKDRIINLESDGYFLKQDIVVLELQLKNTANHLRFIWRLSSENQKMLLTLHESIKGRADNSEGEISLLREKLERKNKLYNEKIKHLEELRKEIDYKNEFIKLVLQIFGKNGECVTRQFLEESIREIKDKFDSLKEQSKTNDDLSEWQEIYESTKSESTQTYNKYKAEILSKINETEKRVCEVDENMIELQSLKEKLDEKQSEIDLLSSKVKNCKCKDISKQIQQLKEQLSLDMLDKDLFEKVTNDLSTEITEINEYLHTLQRELESDNHLDVLEQRLMEKDHSIHNLTENLNSKTKELEKSKTDINNRQSTIIDLENTLTRQNVEVTRLMKSLLLTLKNISQMDDSLEMDERKKQICEMEDRLDFTSYGRILELILQHGNNLKSKYGFTSKELEKLQILHKQTEETIDCLRNKVFKLNNEKQSILKQLNESQDEVILVQLQLDELIKKHKNCNGIITNLRCAVEKCEKETQACKLTVEENTKISETNINSMQRTIEEKDAIVNELKKSLELCRKQIDLMKRENLLCVGNLERESKCKLLQMENDLTVQKTEYLENVSMLKEQIHELQVQVSEKEEQLNCSRNYEMNLKSKTEACIAKLSQQIRTLNLRTEQLMEQKQLDDCNECSKKFIDQITQLQKEVDHYHHLSEKREQMVCELKQTIQFLQNTIANLKQEKIKQIQELQTSITNKDELIRKIQEKFEDEKRVIEKQINLIQMEFETKQNELNLQINKLQHSRDAITKQKNNEIQQLQTEIMTINKTNSILKTKLEQLNCEVMKLKQVETESKQRKTNFNSLIIKLTELEEKQKRFNCQLEQKQKVIDEFKSELNEFNKVVCRKNMMIKDLREKQEKCEEHLNRLVKTSNETSKLRQELCLKEKEIGLLKQQKENEVKQTELRYSEILKEKDKTICSLKEKIDFEKRKLVSNNVKLKDELMKYIEINGISRPNSDALLHNEIQFLRNQKFQLERQVELLEIKHEKVEEECQNLVSETRKWVLEQQNINHRLEKEIAVLKSERNRLINRNNKLNEKLTHFCANKSVLMVPSYICSEILEPGRNNSPTTSNFTSTTL